MEATEFENYNDLIKGSVDASNLWSAEQAQKQMDFQERMSNTAHQREVEDLKAAGLNPILSAHGSGASTPVGAMAEGDRSGTTALFGLIEKMVDSQTAKSLAEYNAAEAAKRASTYAATSAQNADVTAKALKDVLSAFGVKGWTAANVGAAALNAVGNMDTAAVSNSLDSTGSALNAAIGEAAAEKAKSEGKNPEVAKARATTPPVGTSAKKAMEYKQKTGNSSTKVGLDFIKSAANKVRSAVSKVRNMSK